jgi:predicted RNase H-like nuclease
LDLESLYSGTDEVKILDGIKEWRTAQGRVLLAIDAPLGWPKVLGETLGAHRAGELIKIAPNMLFRRETDRFIKEKLNKQSLDIGADRIARTAHAALALLKRCKTALEGKIPLAWNCDFSGVAAIEVYPAATLRAYNVKDTGYKGKKGGAARKNLYESLSKFLSIPEKFTEQIITDDNALDSVICALAGIDFLSEKVYSPPDHSLAEQEGWIWARKAISDS